MGSEQGANVVSFTQGAGRLSPPEHRIVVDLRRAIDDSSLPIGNVVFLPGMEGGRLGRATWRQRMVKRSIDLLGGALALALLAPLLVAVLFGRIITARSSPIHRDPRLGRGGARFDLLGFRTLRLDGTQRFGMDDVFRLLHVLSGRMTIVGPRPLAPDETAAHRRLDCHLAVRPGITGPWRSADDLNGAIAADIRYLDTWSLGLDLRLLAGALLETVVRRSVR